MNEFYELAKQIDVIIVFYIFMIVGVYGITTVIMEGIFLIRDLLKKCNKKKKTAKEKTE